MKILKATPLLVLCTFVLLPSIALGGYYDVYPTETPVTTYDQTQVPHYSELTVDVEPKLMQIPEGIAQTWTVNLTVEVLTGGTIDRVEIRTKIFYPFTTVSNPGSYEALEDHKHLFYMESGTTFDAGYTFTVILDITTPNTLTAGSYELIKAYHRANLARGQESSSDYDVQVHFDVTQFVIPEVPLGTVTILTLAMLSLAIYKKRNGIHIRARNA